MTVGMHDAPFDRLVRSADEMASLVTEMIVIQRGVSRYTPVAGRYFDFADEVQMRKWLSEAGVVVSHGGAGSILSALQASKPLVVVPRLKCYGEVLDDHQLELGEAIASAGRAVCLTDVTPICLKDAIDQASQVREVPSARDPPLVITLRQYLASLIR